MYGDILEELRDGLAVSSSFDARLLRGVKNAARTLLRAYNFRESVRKATIPIGASTGTFALPVDAGKVKVVRLTVLEGGTRLWKRLRRREEGTLPYEGGPMFYSIEGMLGVLDTPLPADAFGYDVEVWYQSNDPDYCEVFLSTTFKDVLEHKAGQELALKMRKSEAYQIYNSLWEQDVAILGRYLPELEFGDLDLSMGDTHRETVQDRYPAS